LVPRLLLAIELLSWLVHLSAEELVAAIHKTIGR
jgi:hypothetical protein